MADNPGATAVDAFAQEMGKDLYATIKRQFSYLCCFSNNVKSMNEAAKNLKDVRDELKRTVHDAWRMRDDLVPTVNTWLDNSEAILNELRDEIEPKIPNPGSGCWPKIKSPFSLGQKVEKITQDMVNFRNKASGFNSDNIFFTAPAPVLLPFRSTDALELKSRKQIEDDIIAVLTEGKVNIVGICGMGGTGKTTMANNILSRMQEEGSFPAVLKVEVSRVGDPLKIQQGIIDSLDSKSKDEIEKATGLELRARILSSKLGQKKLLILLDDIWEAFILEALGIPHEGGCTTLITSRDQDLLKKMHCNNIFPIGTLRKDEAQFLFEEKAGIHLNHPDYRPTAEQILEKCDGLPLAIATIGSTLKGEARKRWDHALSRLEDRGLDQGVYDKLFVSYEFLDDRDAQLLFLLCCLFPEDHHVSLGDLALYAMGLNMFKKLHTYTLKAVRREVCEGVHKLKSRFLLLEGDDENEVKMHDVFRDLAILIATKEGLIQSDANEKCKWISKHTTPSNEPLDHFIMGSNFPDLCLLIKHHQSFWSRGTIKLSNISILQGMQGLNALSFRKVEFESPPEEIEWPNNLLTLQFVYCEGLKTISFVGDLLKLKILDCHGCEEIEELPVEIGQLECLKLLDLSECKNLRRIAPGIIKQLVELEELKMLRSFSKWESSKVNANEGMNVPLNELESLHKLTCLEIQVDDISLVHEKINLSSNLVKYKISISKTWIGYLKDCEKVIDLDGLPKNIDDQSWIHKLIARQHPSTAVEGLNLDGDGSGNWANLSQTHNTLKQLEIRNCGMLKELVDSSIDSGGLGIFPVLRKLILRNLPSLTHLSRSILNQQVLFKNLQYVKVSGCYELQNFFVLGKAKDVFRELETLKIENCKIMEQVFISKDSDKDGKRFPKLKKLALKWNPTLTTFWKGSENSIEFPSLEELDISICEQLKSIVYSGMENESELICGNDGGADQTIPLFCPHKVKLDKLKRLNINSCNNIRSLFSPSMVENLVNLKYLNIEDCIEMESLLRTEKHKDEGKTSHQVTFRKLETLQLDGLPSLISVCKGIERITFPMLKKLDIDSCPKLKEFVSPMEYNQESKEGCTDDDGSFPFLHDEEVQFNKLDYLSIRQCHVISSVFSSSAARNLTSLNYIRIVDCSKIKKVIISEGENAIHGNTILFPGLKCLVIISVPAWEMLCEWKCPIELSMLKEISVDECPHFKFMTNGSLTIPNLEIICIGGTTFVEKEWKVMEDDINTFLCQHMMDS